MRLCVRTAVVEWAERRSIHPFETITQLLTDNAGLAAQINDTNDTETLKILLFNLLEGKMMIADVIRNADTEDMIYFFLCSYIEAARYCHKLTSLPEPIAALPLTGDDDLRSRFELLIIELDAASKRLDNNACVTIKEALIIFATALFRLQSLEGRRSRPLPLEKWAA